MAIVLIQETAKDVLAVCIGCGGELPAGKRKWCGEHCRKIQYMNRCLCGDACWGERCSRCALSDLHEQKMKDRKERWKKILRMRGDGLLNYEIATNLGVSALAVACDVSRMRTSGIKVPESTYDRHSWVWRSR